MPVLRQSHEQLCWRNCRAHCWETKVWSDEGSNRADHANICKLHKCCAFVNSESVIWFPHLTWKDWKRFRYLLPWRSSRLLTSCDWCFVWHVCSANLKRPVDWPSLFHHRCWFRLRPFIDVLVFQKIPAICQCMMFILAIPYEYSQRNTLQQCQAAKQAGVTLWVQTESGVEVLATPKMFEDFSPCDRVTMPRLPKIPDLKQQMVPDHIAAICCNWSCGACRFLRWFTIRKSWTGLTLISEHMWPVKQVILLAECTKHFSSMFEEYVHAYFTFSYSVLRWKLGRAALDVEAVRRQFF